MSAKSRKATTYDTGGDCVITIKRICSLGHEETEYTLEEAKNVLAEGQGRYLIVKDNKIVNAASLEDGDQIVLVPILRGG